MHLYTKITIWLSIFYYRFLLSCHTAVSYISTYIHILETSFLKTIIWSLWLSVTACGELEVAAYRFLSTSNQGEVQRNFGRRCNKIVSEKCYRQGQKIPSFSSLLPPYPTLCFSFSLFQPQEHLASLPSSLTCFSGPWAPINGTSWKILMQAVCVWAACPFPGQDRQFA